MSGTLGSRRDATPAIRKEKVPDFSGVNYYWGVCVSRPAIEDAILEMLHRSQPYARADGSSFGSMQSPISL